MTITKIKQFFVNLKQTSEIFFKIPGAGSADTLSDEHPPFGYIKIGTKDDELQYMTASGSIHPIGSGDIPVPVSTLSWFGGWL